MRRSPARAAIAHAGPPASRPTTSCIADCAPIAAPDRRQLSLRSAGIDADQRVRRAPDAATPARPTRRAAATIRPRRHRADADGRAAVCTPAPPPCRPRRRRRGAVQRPRCRQWRAASVPFAAATPPRRQRHAGRCAARVPATGQPSLPPAALRRTPRRPPRCAALSAAADAAGVVDATAPCRVRRRRSCARRSQSGTPTTGTAAPARVRRRRDSLASSRRRFACAVRHTDARADQSISRERSERESAASRARARLGSGDVLSAEAR